jgi:hypothetical protein
VIEYIINLGPSRSTHVVEEFLMRLSDSWKNALINPAAWIFSSIKVRPALGRRWGAAGPLLGWAGLGWAGLAGLAGRRGWAAGAW